MEAPLLTAPQARWINGLGLVKSQQGSSNPLGISFHVWLQEIVKHTCVGRDGVMVARLCITVNGLKGGPIRATYLFLASMSTNISAAPYSDSGQPVPTVNRVCPINLR
jgi:hypothetical protein